MRVVQAGNRRDAGATQARGAGAEQQGASAAAAREPTQGPRAQPRAAVQSRGALSHKLNSFRHVKSIEVC